MTSWDAMLTAAFGDVRMTPAEAEAAIRRPCDAATEKEALAVLAGSPDSFHQTIAREWRGEERVMEWQPIETAPNDGTSVLVAWSYLTTKDWFIQPAKFRRGVWVHSWDHDEIGTTPTHWMPLPPPPVGVTHE